MPNNVENDEMQRLLEAMAMARGARARLERRLVQVIAPIVNRPRPAEEDPEEPPAQRRRAPAA